MSLISKIKSFAAEIHDEVVDLRRTIHANPELSFEEYETSALVKRELTAMGIEFDDKIAKTGLVGYIKGDHGPGKTIALRADMDALPILEENEIPYKSSNPGKMHACGHDAHTSSLLGTAKILNALRSEFKGTVKLIFQPSEERMPGGAAVMIEEGVLENPNVESIFGQHVLPHLEVGKIGICSGRYMASADEVYLRIKGKGGHAAHPHKLVDTVLIMAHILTGLQSIISRNCEPNLPSVLSFGKVIANGATNIIPNEVNIEGTFRAMNEEWRFKAHELIKTRAREIARAFGGDCEVEILKGYPVLVNDTELTARTRSAVNEFVGPENVEDLGIWMGAEDFAWFSQKVPGCFYRLGTRNEAKGIIHGLHTPLFNIDEDSLKLSTGLMAWCALEELRD